MHHSPWEEEHVTREENVPLAVQMVHFFLLVRRARVELSSQTESGRRQWFFLAEQPFLLSMEVENKNICYVCVIGQSRRIGSRNIEVDSAVLLKHLVLQHVRDEVIATVVIYGLQMLQSQNSTLFLTCIGSFSFLVAKEIFELDD